MKNITENWELNYLCVEGCGVGVYNATHEYTECPECGAKVKMIHPLNSRKKKRRQEDGKVH